jgi:hypothetical protein
MKRIPSFLLAAVVLVGPSPGIPATESAGVVKRGAYEIPMMEEWRHAAPPSRGPEAGVDITLSLEEDTLLPRLTLQPKAPGTAEAGAAVANEPGDAGLKPKGKITREGPCAMPVGGFPARGRMVVRTNDKGESVSQFVLEFNDAKGRSHVATMWVAGDEPPIPDSFDHALRHLRVDGAVGPAAVKQVVNGPEDLYHLILPDDWKHHPSRDATQPDILAQSGVDPSAPGSRPLILLHKKVTPGDKLDVVATAAARERGLKTGWLLLGAADAFRVTRHHPSKGVMEWRYHISLNRRTTLISVVMPASADFTEPPDSVKSVLNSLIP